MEGHDRRPPAPRRGAGLLAAGLLGAACLLAGCLRAGPAAPGPGTGAPAAVRAWFSARFTLAESRGRVRGRLIAVEDGRFRIEVQDPLGRPILVVAHDGRRLTIVDPPGGTWAAGEPPLRLDLAGCRPVWRLVGGRPAGAPPPPVADPCGTEPLAAREFVGPDVGLRIELEGRQCQPGAVLDPALFRPAPAAGAEEVPLEPLLDLPALSLLEVVGCSAG